MEVQPNAVFNILKVKLADLMLENATLLAALNEQAQLVEKLTEELSAEDETD